MDTGRRLSVEVRRELGAMDVRNHGLGFGGLAPQPMSDACLPAVRRLRPTHMRLFVQEYYAFYPARDRFDWSKLDQAVAQIRSVGGVPALCLSMKPKTLFPDQRDTVVVPTDQDQWTNVVRQMVRRYGCGDKPVRFWEVLNEPDIGERGGTPWKPTPEQYVDIYRRLAHVIRAEDPEALVGGPAVANGRVDESGNLSEYVTALVEAVAREGLPFDYVSAHLYGQSLNAIRRSHQAYRDLLNHNGLSGCAYALSEWNQSHRPYANEPQAGMYWTTRAAFTVAALLNFIDCGMEYSWLWQTVSGVLEPAFFRDWMSRQTLEKKLSMRSRNAGQVAHLLERDTAEPTLQYTAYALAYKLGSRRVGVGADDARLHAAATWDDGTLTVLYADMDPDAGHRHFEEPEDPDAFVNPPPRPLDIAVAGLPPGDYQLETYGLLDPADQDAATGEPRVRSRQTLSLAGAWRTRVNLPAYRCGGVVLRKL